MAYGGGRTGEDHRIGVQWLRQKMFSRSMRSVWMCSTNWIFIPHIISFEVFSCSLSTSFACFSTAKITIIRIQCCASHSRSFVSLVHSHFAHFMGHFSNGQIILVLFTTASHITLCLRFRDIHFYRYVSYFLLLLGNFTPTSSSLLSISLWIWMKGITQCRTATERMSVHSKSVWLWALGEKKTLTLCYFCTYNRVIPFHTQFTSFDSIA